MRVTYRLLYDSYQSARGDLKPLFSKFKTPEHIRKAVRRYIMARSQHLQRLGKAQQRSWVRGNLTLVLREARRQSNVAVAAAALALALQEPEWVEPIDPVWVKDALVACGGPQELRQLEQWLSEWAPVALEQDTRVSPRLGGSLLAALLEGGMRGGATDSRSVQIGDGNGEETALAAAESVSAAAPGLALKGDGVPRSDSSDALCAALAHSLPRSSTYNPLLSPEQRAAATFRMLQSQHEAHVVAPNQSFLRYFMKQGLLHSETELMELVQALRYRPRELGFRLHLSTHCFGAAAEAVVQACECVRSLSWLPAWCGAYTLDCTQPELLRQYLPLLRALAKERVLSFQSTSSMLPVCLLDPQPGESVLDLCASPGSKTMLILDYMSPGAGGQPPLHPVPRSMADAFRVGTGFVGGFVTANEVDESRAVELMGRLQNASPAVVVTRMRGESFGALDEALKSPSPPQRNALPLIEGEGPTTVDRRTLYDKVLVDAPCSGEGRLGRDPMAWRLWHPRKALEFFPRQVALLRRAVQLCRPGGVVVYATCTLNPIENEAVVAAVLREFHQTVELVPVPSLPDVHPSREGVTSGGGPMSSPGRGGGGASLGGGRPPAQPVRMSRGLRTWWVPSPSGAFYRNYKEAVAQGDAKQATRGVFPPEAWLDEESVPGEGAIPLGEKLHSCCRRIFPHHNGVGTEGFFVAMLRKKSAPARGSDAVCLPFFSFPCAADADAVADALLLCSSTLWNRPSLFHRSGLIALPLTNTVVQQRLGPFLNTRNHRRGQVHESSDTAAALMDFFSTTALCAVWREGEGLRFVAQAIVELAKQLPAPSGSARLLEMGVLCFNARGELTEAGAHLLKPYATARVLRVPLHLVQVLFSTRELIVQRQSTRTGYTADPVTEARRIMSNGLVGRPDKPRRDGAAAAAAGDESQWQNELLRVVGGGSFPEGNAIVLASSSLHTAAEGWQRFVEAWPLPVHVSVLPHQRLPSEAPFYTTGADEAPALAGGLHDGSVDLDVGTPLQVDAVKLRVLLSAEACRRYTAMIGRLQAAERRGGALDRQRLVVDIQASRDFNASTAMGQAALYGADKSVAQRQIALFGVAADAADAGGPVGSDSFEL